MLRQMRRRVIGTLIVGVVLFGGYGVGAAASHTSKRHHQTPQQTAAQNSGHHRTTTSGTTTTSPKTTTTTSPPSSDTAGSYPLHSNIVSTTFWVGEIYDASIADGSQVCSTYDSDWAYHWSGGVDIGTDPSTDCAGAPLGGCDGVPSGSGSSFTCTTEKRTAANGYFPTSSKVHPAENPFYLDLPYDDINNKTAYDDRCSVVPWASQYPASDCKNPNFSYMKNHWFELTGPNGNTCYGQVEDAGPYTYDDEAYVFGTAKPSSKQANNAGLDVSPALNGCLGFKELDGDGDHVSWRFVDASAVPSGPWTKVVTTRPPDE
jgi:hypothetical protein